MNLTDSLFSTIDVRSFSNLWFWLVLAVAWSNVTHFVMGVPFDMVQRARRQGGEAMRDLNTLAAIQARRRLGILRASGVWLVGFWMAVLTSLALLGFRHGFELAQASFLLLAPLSLAGWLSLRLSLRVATGALVDEPLVRAIFWYRVVIQAVGLAAILVTTMWGMWHNLSVSTLGG
ncbi:component of SufBCD complex [Pararhodobacter marinus]|uniref:Component of SufBCD complex n=1 Tax=Pararhodobacter marinus TaxID=2184063 RepID=A0A2U2CE47_9RHOB|nr:component of SufBCD complex [Pararhodobacter marinus]PWE30178.1 component of SufBCD complex [Pararhodobacter marinus]